MLKRIPFMSLAVADRSGRPYISMLLFASDRSWNIYFATHEETAKAQVLAKNPRVSLCMYELGNGYFQMSGTAKKVHDAKLAAKVMDEIAAKAAGVEKFWPPILAQQGEVYAVYRIETNWVRCMDLKDMPIRSRTPKFLQIK